MATEDKNPNKPDKNQKLYEKFKVELNYLIVYAKAASINAKLDCIYPESFMVAFLSTGEHEVTAALLANNVDLEKLLKRFKNTLELKRTNNAQGTLAYDDFKIAKGVWDAIKAADKISQKADQTHIGMDHLFIGFLETFSELELALKEDKIDIAKIIDELKIGKHKKGLKPKKAKASDASELLSAMCINITEQARQEKLDPILARDEEIEEAITILCRRNKRNPLLVGEPGTGKTAIVDGIAQRIISNTVPEKLKGCEIYNLSMSDLVAGTKYRGEFEGRIKDLIKEVESNPKVILFVDEIHTIVGAGSANGSLDAANIFKPALARGMRCIGATTRKEFKKYIMGDGALERRFEKVNVNEPGEEQVKQILNGIKHRLEEYHQCTIPSDVIDTAVKFSGRYLTSSFFPDKAIDCIDTACAKYAWGNKQDGQKPSITEKDVVAVISKKSKMPAEVMLLNNKEKLDGVEKELKKKIVGQDKAVDAIIRVVANSYSGIGHKDKPIGIFVFGGQTGTGKTYTAKQIAKNVFVKDESFIQIDMSEYSEKHTASRILGSPPGYVGFDDSETELEKIKRNPYSLLLLDEIDKADPQVIKVFLQVMKEGVITDATGEKVNCRNIILVITGNFGMNENRANALGFGASGHKTGYEIEQDRLIYACKSMFGAEFVNRVDEFIPFMPLGKDDIHKIVAIHLDNIKNRIPHKNISMSFADGVVDKLIVLKDKEHGQNAMMIDRLISKNIEPILSDAILKMEDLENFNYSVTIDIVDDKFVCTTKKLKVKNEKRT